MPENPDHAEVLQQRGGEPWPWRRIIFALLAGAVVAAGLVSTDRAARSREEAALAACVAAGDRAVERAWEPVVSMAYYIRPTLFQVPDGRTRDGIFDLVAREAEGRDRLVSEARAGCADITIWWLHGDLRERRDACSAALGAATDRLAAVARDGRVAFEGVRVERCA